MAARTLNPQHGSALISALIAVIIISIMALGLSALTMTSNGIIMDTEDREHALLLAESGLAIGFKNITNPMAYQQLADGSQVWHEVVGGTREITVLKGTNAAGLPTLLSTGTVEKKLIIGNVTIVSRTLEAVVGYTIAAGAFASGAFGLSDLTVGGNFSTDSYDSSVAPYSAATKGHTGDIGTNGPIVMNGASFYVDGSAHPGPGQDPISRPGQITGSGAPLLAPVSITIPPYVVPTGATELGGTPATLGAGNSTHNYHISSLSSTNNQTITISGTVNLYVDGDISLKGDLRLADNNAVLNIWQNTGSVVINGGGASNESSIVHYPEQTVTLPAGSTTTAPIVRTILKDTQNQSAPTISASDTVVANTQTTGHGNNAVTTTVSWTITTPANTVVTAPVNYTIDAYDAPGQGIPGHFNLISQTTSTVKLNGNSTYFGTVVAPNAPVTINGTADKYGAVIGNNMTLLGTGDFHNDTSAKSPGIVSMPKLLSYRELPPPPTENN